MNWSDIQRKFKKAWTSVTVWFAMLGLPTVLVLLQYAADNLPLFKDNLGTAYGVVYLLLGLIISILRVRKV